MEAAMGSDDEINRRDLIIGTAGAIGVAAGVAGAARTAEAAQPLPPGFAEQERLRNNWTKALADVVDFKASDEAADLKDVGGQERHRIYCYLLMKLIHRFWNGNKKGPLGTYPWRNQQQDMAQALGNPKRYQGDIIVDPSFSRVKWDRYLGHN